ncbi:MAG: hypothetical protein H0W30_05450 [Gemmatimonadaceae bacterium]|nr:hypothetical protein [Gemmatimonadaceae bacterium]
MPCFGSRRSLVQIQSPRLIECSLRNARHAGGLDLIVASDVLYEKEYARLLPGIFRDALGPGGVAIVADPGRVGVPEFIESCAEAGLTITSRVTYPFEVEAIKQQIDIYQIAPRGLRG